MLTTTGLLVIGLSAIMALALIGATFAWSWKGWLNLKRHQLDHGQDGERMSTRAGIGNRIELADLRERVRKLEAIAAGVDM